MHAEPTPLNLLPLVFAMVVAVGSAVYRLWMGKDLFAWVPENALFVERWTSGRYLKNILTRMGGARNCLMVAVTPEVLRVCPHFPFTLIFLPEVYGLDWTIPKSAIHRVEPISGPFVTRIRVEFQSERGGRVTMELRLRAPEQFESALAECAVTEGCGR